MAPLLAAAISSPQLEYDVEVQVVELQVSVIDGLGNFQTELTPDDFVVYENGIQQEVLDLELQRQPFSIGIILDTSSSMQSQFLRTGRAAKDFVRSLQPKDEYFVMTFDDRIVMRNEMQLTSNAIPPDFLSFRFGERTRLFEGVMAGIERLKNGRYPQRALFLISDGVNSRGDYGLEDVIQTAQRNKTLIYSLIVQKGGSDLFVLQKLSHQTGGTSFVLEDDFPRLQAAYERIASDLAHRITLYYHSTSDYSQESKPEIQIHMKNPDYKVRFQKAFYFRTSEE